MYLYTIGPLPLLRHYYAWGKKCVLIGIEDFEFGWSWRAFSSSGGCIGRQNWRDTLLGELYLQVYCNYCMSVYW